MSNLIQPSGLGGAPIDNPTFTTAITTPKAILSGRSIITSPVDGNILLQNNAQIDLSLLQFGGVTAAFPAIKRNAAGIDLRLADDSGFAPLKCGGFLSTYPGTGATSNTIFEVKTGITQRLSISDNGGFLLSPGANTMAIAGKLLVNSGSNTDIGSFSTRLESVMSANSQQYQLVCHNETAGTIAGTGVGFAMMNAASSGRIQAGAVEVTKTGAWTAGIEHSVMSLRVSRSGTLTTMAQVDADTTAGATRFLLYDIDAAALKRVVVGAADSAGVGFKSLRIVN